MKVLAKLIVGAVVASALPLGTVSAASITNTGPNSTSTITQEQNCDVKVTNNNDVKVSNTNRQTADSGDSKVRSNTSAGGAQSGSAQNENSTNANIGVTNQGVPGCAPQQAVTPPKPGPTPQPQPTPSSVPTTSSQPAGGRGAGVAAAASAVNVGGAGQGQPAVLPETGDASRLASVAAVLASGIVMTLGRIGVLAYRGRALGM